MKKILITAIAILSYIAGTKAQNVYIPDSILKAALVNNTRINTNRDTNIQISEASAYRGAIHVSGLGITDLTGIAAFTALDSLYCPYNQLTSLDVSACTALTYLACHYNQLTSLDVSGCTALTYLDCFNNQLTSLDVSTCNALTNLDCNYNQLTSLDVSGCTALTNLYCSYNQLTSLDVSSCTALTWVDCYNTQLTSLDVSSCTALTVLYCYDNQLTSLDVSSCTALTYLYCSGNQLTSLDVSSCTALTYLYCHYNNLTSLDVSSCTALTYLDCFNNQLTSLDVSSCTALTYLACCNNQLTSLDLKNGNNINMSVLFDPLFGDIPAFLAYNNPNLSCIEVDNVAWSTANWLQIDATASFSESCSGTGINKIAQCKSPQVYPNPTTGNIYLSVNANIVLTDLFGKVLLEQKNINQLDISTLPSSMYFLRVGENLKQTFKVIKE